MKKIVSFFAVAMCIVLLLLSLTACSSFMSNSQVKKVIKEFGTPQAEMSLTFTTSKGGKFKYVITYDLLLDKTPITTINFINLVESGYYDNAIFDSYNSSNNYFLAGRYTYTKTDNGSRGYESASGLNIVGEFKTNNYSAPQDGYEQFSLFSLAMYHEAKAESFDLADGALIFSTASSSSETKKPLNYTNYAVFARMSTISIYACKTVDGVETEDLISTYPAGKVNSQYLDDLVNQTSTTTCTMTKSNGDSSSVTILGSGYVPRFVFSIKMLGDKDWTKLPKVN